MNESAPEPKRSSSKENVTGILKRSAVVAGLASLGVGTHASEKIPDGEKIDTAKTIALEKPAPHSPAPENSVSYFEKREVAGLVVEGMVPLSHPDSTKEFFLLRLSRKEANHEKNRSSHAIKKIKEAIALLGYQPGDHLELQTIYETSGNKELITRAGGYAMALGDMVADQNRGFATVNPVGMKMYELNAIDELDFLPEDYAYLVVRPREKK